MKNLGADLIPFSPMHDSKLPSDIHGLYLGGGYPEMYAQKLESNVQMKQSLLKCHQKRMPIHAECGGFIYLCQKLILPEGHSHEMTGIFRQKIVWDRSYLAIKYVEVETLQNTILGPKRLKVRGQEFHQTRLLEHLQILRL